MPSDHPRPWLPQTWRSRRASYELLANKPFTRWQRRHYRSLIRQARDRKLITISDKAMATWLVENHSAKEYIRFSHEYLALACQISLSTTNDGLKRLRRAGLIFTHSPLERSGRTRGEPAQGVLCFRLLCPWRLREGWHERQPTDFDQTSYDPGFPADLSGSEKKPFPLGEVGNTEPAQNPPTLSEVTKKKAQKARERVARSVGMLVGGLRRSISGAYAHLAHLPDPDNYDRQAEADRQIRALALSSTG